MKTLKKKKCTDFIRSQIKFYLEFSRWALFNRGSSFLEGSASWQLTAIMLRFLYIPIFLHQYLLLIPLLTGHYESSKTLHLKRRSHYFSLFLGGWGGGGVMGLLKRREGSQPLYIFFWLFRHLYLPWLMPKDHELLVFCFIWLDGEENKSHGWRLLIGKPFSN